MITNINLTLYNNKKIKTWVDNDKVDNTTLLRLFNALERANNLNEQLVILDKVTQQRGYNELAEETMLYAIGTDKVNVTKCRCVDGKYRRGNVVRIIKLS